MALLARLVRPGFVTLAGQDRLPHLQRYLRAAQVRLDALPQGVARDLRLLAEITVVQQEIESWLRAMAPAAASRRPCAR